MTDSTVEPDETITFSLNRVAVPATGTIGTPSSVTVTIRGTDSAPDFGTGSVTDKSYTYGTAITEFQVPAATGGNGVVSYTASGLPAGLVFDADGSGSCPGTEAREICGTPTGGGSSTVTITAADADSNTASSDEDTLTFTVTVAGTTLASALSPLTEANLNGATLTVTLPSGVGFVGGVNPSSFALVATPAIPGLSISGSGFSTRLRQGTASATLTLATGAGYGFNVPSTLAVRVSAAATTASGALTSAALAVSPTPGVTLSRRSLALQEAPGTNNANRGTYTLVMDSPLTGCTSINVQSSSDNADVTVSPTSLTFNKTDPSQAWNAPQTFTVTAGQDADGTHDAATITHRVAFTDCADYPTSLTLPSLSVSVHDDEAPSASISATNPTTLTEANLNSATVTVALANGATFGSGVGTASFELVTDIPGVSVDSVSSVSSGDTSAVLTLAFSGDFTAVETLAVTVLNAAHSASEDLTTGARTVTPTPGIALSRTTLALEEDPAAGGGTNANVGTYTVALTADPTTASGDTSCFVNIEAASNNADVAIDTDGTPRTTARVVFDGTDWNTPQTVTVTVSGDSDGADDAATISHRRVSSICTGDYFGTPTLPSLTVNVNDDETPALVIDADPSTPATADPGPLALDELSSSGANSESFTVKLAVEPTANVTVNVYSDDTPVTVDNVNAMGILPLTFTTGNWSTAQTVTLTAAQDADGMDESVTITAEVPAGGTTEYAGVSATLTATVNDDEAPSASISATSPAALTEGNLNTATLTVALANATYEAGVTTASFELVTDIPNVSVSGVSSVNSGDTSAVLTLAFTGDFTGIETLAVRVLAAAHSSTEDVTTATVNVTASAGVTVSKSSLVLEEAPGSNNANRGTYTLVLEAPPTGCAAGVFVDVASNNADVTTNLGSFNFTNLNWNTPRTVTVTAAQDTDGVPDTATLSHSIDTPYCSASTGYTASLSLPTLEVTVNDDEVGVAITPTPAALTEATLHGATVAVTLNATTFAAGAPAAGTGAFELVTTPAIANLSIAQVSGVTNGGTTATLTLAFTGNFRALPTLAVRIPAGTHTGSGALTSNAVTVTANAGVTVSAASLSLNEAPGSTNANVGTYTVVLDKPFSSCGSVSVRAMSDNSDVTVSPSLGFSSTNPAQAWNVPRTFTVTAGQDDDGADDAATISHDIFVNCDADGYPITLSIPSVSVAVDDDEMPEVIVDSNPATQAVDTGALALTEGSATGANWSVRLGTPPTQTVTVTLTSADEDAVTIDDTDSGTGGVQNTLTFTTANWDTAQTATARAADDDDARDESVTLTATTATATESEYYASGMNGLEGLSATVTATVDDDETRGIVLSATTLAVPEAASATYEARLAAEPVGGTVTVTITGAGSGLTADTDADTSGDQTTLSFTAANWNTDQTVTVSAANDANGVHESVMLLHTASGADYGAVTATLTATATDDESPSLDVSETALTVDEGSSGTYTVRLNSQPTATVTVTVSGAGSGVTVDTSAQSGNQNTLTFTAQTWDTNQTVTVAAAEDDNGVDETVNLAHAASGGDYGTLTGAALPGLRVTADDNDTPAVLIDADPVTTTVDEAGPLALQELAAGTNSASYTVRLGTEPTATTTVTITSADDGAVTVDDTDGNSGNGVQNTLTFTSSNWSTAQTATLTAAQDNDGVHESVVVTNAASTASTSEYANVSATITATVTDDDVPGFVFDADPSTPATADAEPLNLDELSSSTTNADDYSVRLSAQPTQDVTVSVSSPDTGAVTVGASTLTFTTTNWNTAQTVTLTAAQDLDGADESVDIAHSASTATNSEYTGVSDTFEAAVDDDETPAITLSPTALNVNEQNTATYTVALATLPTESVTVAITGAGSGISVDLTSLSFTTTNWNTARTVTASAIDDQNSANEQVTLTHTATGGDYDTLTADLEVTAQDNDTPRLNVSTASLTVPENDSRTYTIRLNTQPSATVTVTVGGAGSGVTVDTDAMAGNQNTLTFTAMTWETDQTVTVSAAEDDNGVDEVVSLTHTASGGGYGSLMASARPGVTVRTDDNDTPAVLLDANPATPNVDEAGPLALQEPTSGTNTASYTVRLGTEPTATVTVTITSADANAVSVNDTDNIMNGVQNTLTFTTANWDTAQTVTLTAEQDADGVDESEVVTNAATSTDSQYAGLSATITATVDDDDAPGFVFDADPSTPATADAEPLNLDELSTSTTNADDYSVRLSAQPTQDVTVAITSPDTGAVTVGTSSLTFTTTDWDTAQTVTVTAQQDDDGADESVDIAHAASTASTSEYTGVTDTFEAAVDDDETPAITLSPTALNVNEQNTATYTVALATLPTESVTVAITGAGSGISIDLSSLSFTTSNWNTDQTVTASAVNDDNSVNESVTLTHTATGGDYDTLTADLEVTAQDDDTPRLNVSAASLTVPENDSRTYTIRLNTQPSATVTVTVGGAGSGVAVDTDAMAGNQNTLTFTDMTWAMAQTVTVSAAEDDNGVDEVVSLTHTASGGGYGSLMASARPGVTVRTDDNDTPAVLLDAIPATPAVDDAGPLALNELSSATNNSVSYSVRLATEPTATVTVTITSADANAVSVDDTDGNSGNGVQNTLSFTSSTWDTAQTVTVTAAQDNDGVNENVAITNAASTVAMSEYTNLSATITATVQDDEAPGFVFDADPSTPATADAEPLNLDELAGSTTNSDDYSVRLTSQPTQDVTVTITSPDTGAVTVGTSSLTFTTTDWATAQTVTVTAQQDLDGADESVEIAHAASTATNSEYTGVTDTFEAAVDDDETPAITLAPTALNVNEQNTATYTVALATQPKGGGVAIAVTGAGSGISIDRTSLAFTATNWNTAQTVTASAADDTNSVNESVTLTHTATGADYDTLTADLEVTALDDDQPSLNVSTGNLTVPENGSGTYTIRLNTQPSANVTVTVNGAGSGVAVDTDAMAGNQNTLTFTDATWETAQTVTVSAAEDDNGVDEVVALTHTASGGGYGSLMASARPGVTVTADDDDEPALVLDADPSTPGVVDPGPLTLNELSGHADNSKGYTVRLATEPTGSVTVDVSSGDRAVHVDAAPTPRMRTLTFTTTNWSMPQTVTAAAAEDDDASDEEVVISHSASGSDYAGVSADLRAETTDDDVPALVVDAGSLVASGLAEGASATYTVRLNTEPTGRVLVSASAQGGVTVDADGGQSGLQPSLWFDAADWNVPQTVTVRARRDDDGASATAVLRHSASGVDYGGVAAAPVSFAVTDPDAPAVMVSAPTLSVNEGSAALYEVSLATRPSGGAVTVALSSSSALATVSSPVLVFTASDWSRPRQVTVQGASDGTATLSHTVSGADYGSVSPLTVMVTVRDSDAAGVRVEPPQLLLREGGSGSYSVRLNTASTGTATVTATGVVGLSLSSGGPLLFTASDWNVERTVSVTVADDDDPNDGTLTVSHGVSGYSGVSSAPTLNVLVSDDDVPGFVFAPGGLSLSEGGGAASSAIYQVRLATRPTGQVAVTASSDDAGLELDTDGTPRTLSLTFTASNWSSGQTVSVRAVADGDRVSETAVLLHEGSGGGYDGASGLLRVRVRDSEARPPSPQPPSSVLPPEVAGLFEDLELGPGESVLLDLSGKFRDDGPLRHAAQSSDPSVATAVASQSGLRVAGLSPGVATVTVTATDLDGLSVSQSFVVSVGRLVSFASAWASAPEGGTLRLELSLSRPAPSSGLRVSWSGGPDGEPSTADADAGDLGVLGGTAEFAPGGTETFIEISVLDDDDAEPAREYLLVSLAPPPEGAGWALGLSQATLEIQEGVCDRTPAVREALRGAWECWAPTPTDLSRRGYLGLRGLGLSTLRAGDLQGLSRLRALHLHDNRLQSLPAGLFEGLASLERLRLDGNLLPGLPEGILAGLGRLSSLRLDGNRLTSLPPSLLSGAPNLQRLDLGGNRLESLPSGLFAGAANLAELNLEGNPGAPFALVMRLERTDAELWAPGPASVQAQVAEGAPFALSAEVLADSAELSSASASVPAGALAGPPLQADPTGPGTARLSLFGMPSVPQGQCGDVQDGRHPCFRGLSVQAGPPLILFKPPPGTTDDPPMPTLSANGERASFALDGLFSPSEAEDQLSYEAESDRPDLVSVRIQGDALLLLIANEDGAEGVAVVTVTATDTDGQSASLSFSVTVEFAPQRLLRSWRLEWLRGLREAAQ